jgi:hypothetical protein
VAVIAGIVHAGQWQRRRRHRVRTDGDRSLVIGGTSLFGGSG